ncbi:hypothetical protein HFP15_16210 [Amycolatopsis sp. K13G38]|uniref:Abortive infection protein n=1 Tax=Amycolatopsis acididurans TaxID=2724524 RepID=A0ABX1J7J9_9PSEU|nr:hypothetical protein [Amycolatopsis acididurans]NKQ54425.1 hypothetical protein [Amycolatopsis acididurans]
MRTTGISYDTGFVRDGGYSREHFDPDVVRRELTIIRDDLHCTAVRLIGGDAPRLELAANIAADLGLEVWFSPYPLELGTEDMLALFADCAARAERLRGRGAEVVFVAGAELSLMAKGFLPGDTVDERLGSLLGRPDHLPALIGEVSEKVNAFLADAVTVVRAHFGGRLTYAAIPLERVDWAPFDIVSADLYRTAETAGQFADGVRALVAQGKPVAITEFGTTARRGAADLGGRCMEIVEYDKRTGAPLRLDGEYERDEQGQATYLRELLEIFDAGGVEATFVFLLALDGFTHRPSGDPRQDLDLGSPAIVKMLEHGTGDTYPDLPWEPKAAFRAVAEYYRP